MLLLLLVANLGSVRAQEKPRLGRDGRPLLNKPKVGHAAFYRLHLRHIQSIHVKQYPSNSAVKKCMKRETLQQICCVFFAAFCYVFAVFILKKIAAAAKKIALF